MRTLSAMRSGGLLAWSTLACAEALRRVVQVHRKCTALADRLLGLDVEELLRRGGHLEIMRMLWDTVGAE